MNIGFDALSAVHDLPTPVLVVDGATVRRNIEKLAVYAKARGLGIRPHTKTHKSRMLARLQIEAGAVGLSVAKAGEAEQMVLEADDVLMAYPVVDPHRARILAGLALTKTIHVAVDNAIAVEALSAAAQQAGSTIGLLVDVNVGMDHTGVGSPQDALKLAQVIDRSKGVRLDGVFYYPGHVWAPIDEQAAPLAAVQGKLQAVLDLWKKNGFSAQIVSGGSTPTAFQSHHIPVTTEIRPGTYVFNDMNTFRGGFCQLNDCAAFIVATVVSNAILGQVVLDGGTKTFTSDLCIPARESGHGYIVEYPEAKLLRLSEEHGQVDISQCSRVRKVGERVTIIPNHICPCVNLRDQFVWVEAGGELRTITVDTRGKLT